MFQVMIGLEEKGEFKEFKQAVIVMIEEVIKKFPGGLDQQLAETVWITDTEEEVKFLKRISFHNAIARAKREGMTKEDLGIT